MNIKQILLILLAISVQQISVCQTETYTVEKTSFSSDFYDEFAPVFYKNGLVFCTNRNSGMTDYSTSLNAKFIKIYHVDSIAEGKYRKPRLFSKYLRTRLNDGPATFNTTGDTVYFSNNLITQGNLRKISASRNKLGIFYAVREENKWTRIREMRFNNEWYNISTPYLSPEGKRIYFSSDKPDGFGGSDIYYSERKGEYWSDPVNLGPVINTKGNESYPFITAGGDLYFSSDGHPGFGGKDIFYSRMVKGKWLKPVRLDNPVNSQYDDFAFITDSLGEKGYFSSARGSSIDIYQFIVNYPQIFYADLQKDNQYCFRFHDTGTIDIDTLNLKYLWKFGDGQEVKGPEPAYCFKGPGKYDVKLDIEDKSNERHFFTKLLLELDLEDVKQPYIYSSDAVMAGEEVTFDGLRSYLPGYRILSYYWDFGDGTRTQGEKVSHIFKKPGNFIVKMGVKTRSLTTGIIYNEGISKQVAVFNNQGERNDYLAARKSDKSGFSDFRKNSNLHIKTLYSAEEQTGNDIIYRVELSESKDRIGIRNSVFGKIPQKYTVEEEQDTISGNWHYYLTDEYLSLMSAWPAWSEMVRAGFNNACVRIYIITDPVRKEIISLLRNYGTTDEFYFDNYNRLRANAYLMLDQIVILMNRNPELRLEVGVHTDNSGSAANNLRISQTRAQVMVNYLINRGINSARLIAKGYGATKPIASNSNPEGRQANRRIDLKVIN